MAVIVPCRNEEEVLPATNLSLLAMLASAEKEGLAAAGSFVVYVDDGSSDATWQLICDMSADNVRGLRLSRNYGHQEALMAGMEYALGKADACVTIDADLQDDVDAIPEMLRHHRDGAEIVFGVRADRKSDSWFKRNSAKWFYRVMKGLGVECQDNHADFRLMGRRSMADLMEYNEKNLFLRGIVPMLGYRQEKVYYQRRERLAGTTKYPLWKMLDFAINGITSFSVRPVRMLSCIGLLFMLTAACIFVYALIRHFSGETIEGWTSLMLSIWFCTGVLLLGLGLIGEYIGKIYIEVKGRPRYRVADRSGGPEGSDELKEMEFVEDLHSRK